jgi:hypothetical protein
VVEGAGVEDPHRVAERRQQPAGVELDALLLIQPTCSWEELLESAGVLLDRAGAATLGELEEWRGSEGWPEAQVEQLLESAP